MSNNSTDNNSTNSNNNSTGGLSFDLNNDPNADQAAKFVGISVEALLATMSGAFAFFVVQVIVFLFVRRRLARIYEPRTYMVPERKKTVPPPKGWFAWIPAMLTTRDPEYIAKSGLDAFTFLRFLRMMLKICILQGLLIIPIMLPLNATGGSERARDEVEVLGLDKLSWSNINRAHTERRTAALLMALWAVGVVCYVTYDEMRGFIRLRQAYLTSPQHRLRASATTVLVTSIPEKWMTYDEMINLYDILPGGLKNVWLNRDYSQLVEKIDMRIWFAKLLEAAETELVKKCMANHLKEVKKEKGNKAMKKAEDGVEMVEGITQGTPDDFGFQGHKHLHSPRPPSNPFKSPTIPNPNFYEKTDEEGGPQSIDRGDSGETSTTVKHGGEDDVMDPKDFEYREDPETALWRKYIQPTDRPTMRVPLANWMPSLPLIGRKVDTIYYCRQQLAILNEEIPKEQSKPEKFPLMNSAFLQFQSQIAAHMACQATNHHIPLRMAPRFLEVAPTDVLWDNLHIRWWDRYLRFGASNAAVVGLIIAWSVPMVFVASLSQLSHLVALAPWLGFLLDLPEWFISVLQGLLPPILLALLTAVLLPLLLQTLAKYSGLPTRTAADRTVQNWYFAFLFITVFFVVSVSSAIFGTIKDWAENPIQIPTKLAATLPRASNFFFSYLLVQALGISGGALLQIAPLILYYVVGPLFNHTPREKWNQAKQLKFVTWGTFFPLYTNFGVIAIVYSVIAPLALIFAGMVFGLFWLVYRYNLLYVMDYQVDSGGQYFPRAINHLYSGLYIMEICMAGLFFLVRDENDDVYCLPHAIIMIVVFFMTIIFHKVMHSNFAPLIEYLPITLEDDADASDKEFARRFEERRRLLQEDAAGANEAALAKVDEAHEEPDGQKPGEGKHADGDVTENGEGGAKKANEETAEERADKIKGKDGDESDSGDSSDSEDDEGGKVKRPGTSHSKASTKASKKQNALGAVTNALGINKIAAVANLPVKALKKIPGVQLEAIQRLNKLRQEEEAENTNETEATKKKRRLEMARLVRQLRQDDYSDYTDVNDLREHILASSLAPAKPHYDDLEQQQKESKTRRLFAHIQDDLGDLSYEEREQLMEQAYKHPCLIARQPAVWIPTDVLGVSTDEIKNTPPEVWISNEHAYLKFKTKVVFEGNPPDFGVRDLIDL